MDWIKQFSDMLFPLEAKNLNIEGALILKNQNIPSSLFKYRKVNTEAMNNLDEDTIWLSDPSKFNDPYDCFFTINFKDVAVKVFPELIKSEEFKKIGITIPDEITKSLDPLAELIEDRLKNEPEKKKDTIRSMFQNIIDTIYANMSIYKSKQLASDFKLSSFSERKDSLLMWAHYANNHEGFCLEYDIKSIPSSDNRRILLFPVIYSDKIFDATEYMTLPPYNRNNLYLTQLSEL